MFQANHSGKKTEQLSFEFAIKLMIWCMPALILLLIGILGIGIMPNQDSLPSLIAIILIGLIITRIIFLLRSTRKAVSKAALLVSWIIILAVVAFFGLFMSRTIHHVIKADAQSRFEADISSKLPKPIEAGAAKSLEYHAFFWSGLIYESRTRILLCQYDEEGYQRAISSIDERLHFRTEPIGTGYYDNDRVEIMDEPYSMIGDERFRMVYPGDGDASDFYKMSYLIMTNETKHQIAYIAYYDFDLDMAESLEKLITEYSGWKYLRQ